MSKRILLAGLLGGIAMFMWMSLAHVVLPLGQTGVRELPNEQVVLNVMQTTLGGNHGLYLFPGMGVGPDATREQRSAAMQKYGQKLATNPSGLLVYHPAGAQAMTPRQLGIEFLVEFLEALLVVFLLAQTRLTGFASRVGFATVAGIMAAITTNISYWNWYGFPTSYTAVNMTTQIAGYVLVGVIAALVLKSDTGKKMAATA